MLHALQQYLRHSASVGRRVREVGPFALLVHPSSDHPFLNYAIPQPGAAPTAAEVAALVAAFAEEGLVPRLELLPAVAPAVEGTLISSGFAVEARLRLMACGPERRRAVPVPPGVRLVDVDPAADPDAALALTRVQTEAFGEPADDEGALREGARRKGTPAVLALVDGPGPAAAPAGGAAPGEADPRGGGRLAGARAAGTPAGGGECQPAIGGTAEIVGIGVLPAFRRRGIAAAVTGRLLERSFASGVERAILSPGDEDTARVYARCGFATCGEVLHLRRER